MTTPLINTTKFNFFLYYDNCQYGYIMTPQSTLKEEILTFQELQQRACLDYNVLFFGYSDITK